VAAPWRSRSASSAASSKRRRQRAGVSSGPRGAVPDCRPCSHLQVAVMTSGDEDAWTQMTVERPKSDICRP